MAMAGAGALIGVGAISDIGSAIGTKGLRAHRLGLTVRPMDGEKMPPNAPNLRRPRRKGTA
jgi:hypothetical protein